MIDFLSFLLAILVKQLLIKAARESIITKLISSVDINLSKTSSTVENSDSLTKKKFLPTKLLTPVVSNISLDTDFSASIYRTL